MREIAQVWMAAAVAGALVALAGAVAARWWRRHDVVFWHRIYSLVMAATLVAPIAGLMLPTIRISWHISNADRGGAGAAASWSLVIALAVVYAIGLVAMILRTVMGLVAIHRLRRGSMALDHTWQQWLAPVAGADANRCCWHAQVRAPLTLGWLRPLVVLPASARRWPVERLRAVLHHEFAHVRRHDYALNVMAAVHVAVFWPSPAAWWLARKARLAAEVACDRSAAEAVGESEYTRVLLQCARDFTTGGHATGLVAPGVENDLFERVEILLAPHPPLAPMPWTRAALTFTAITAALFVACLIRLSAIPGPRPDAAPGIHTIRHNAAHQARHR